MYVYLELPVWVVTTSVCVRVHICIGNAKTSVMSLIYMSHVSYTVYGENIFVICNTSVHICIGNAKTSALTHVYTSHVSMLRSQR